jgi:hypothetical protein
MPVPGKMCGASSATGWDYNTGLRKKCIRFRLARKLISPKVPVPLFGFSPDNFGVLCVFAVKNPFVSPLKMLFRSQRLKTIFNLPRKSISALCIFTDYITMGWFSKSCR